MRCVEGSTRYTEGSISVMDCVCGSGDVNGHDCPPGDVSDWFSCNTTKGGWDCKPCDIGWYSVAKGSKTCYECPDGMTTPGVGSANADDCVCTALYGIDFGSSLGEPNDGFLHDVLASDTYGLHSITLFSRFDEDIQQVASIGPPGNNRQAGVVRVKEPVERRYPDFQMKRLKRVEGLTAAIFTSKYKTSSKYGCCTSFTQPFSIFTPT